MQRSSMFFKFFALASFLIASFATAAPSGLDGFSKKRERILAQSGLSDKAIKRHEKASQRSAKRSQKSGFQALKQKNNRRQNQAARMSQTSFARENLLACASGMIRNSAHKGMKARGGNGQRKAAVLQGKTAGSHKGQAKTQSRTGHKAQAKAKAQVRTGHKNQAKAQTRTGHKAQAKAGHKNQAKAHRQAGRGR